MINTGGEKVFAEKVEEAVRAHPGVEDCLAVGVPDPRWGEVVCAVVRRRADGAALDDLVATARTRLAAFEVPRRVVVAAQPLRLENGKGDYALARRLAREAAGSGTDATPAARAPIGAEREGEAAEWAL